MVQPTQRRPALAPSIELPRYQGYISVAPGKRYFQDEAGQGFLVLGQNDAITWPGLMELLEGASLETTENYIKDLRAHGVTVSRVMLEYAQFDVGYLENPVGVFNPEVVAFWDQFIQLAEKHGLYLLLTPYDTFWQVKRWEQYPYSGAQDGPCQQKHDWLTHPNVIAAHKARWQFVLERWGGSPNIFAWDLMNEVELYFGSTPQEIERYITEMAAFVRQTEQARWGRTHLLTVSSAEAVPSMALGEVIFNHPDLDFANTHLYVGLGIRSPLDAVEGTGEMIDGVRLCLQSIEQPRPYLDTESGPIDTWIRDASLDVEYHHNLSWAHLMAGAAGSGMRWPYTDPHWLLPAMRDTLLGMARFAATIDWAHFASRNLNASMRVSQPGLFKTGCTDNTELALLWLLVDTRLPQPPTLSDTLIALPNILPDGVYSIEYWETYQGCVLTTATAKIVDGKLNFTLPRFDPMLKDVAIVIRRAKA